MYCVVVVVEVLLWSEVVLRVGMAVYVCSWVVSQPMIRNYGLQARRPRGWSLCIQVKFVIVHCDRLQ